MAEKDQKIIGLYHKLRAKGVEPEVVVYQHGNVAICRGEDGESINNENALEILTQQLETHEMLLGIKGRIGFMAK